MRSTKRWWGGGERDILWRLGEWFRRHLPRLACFIICLHPHTSPFPKDAKHPDARILIPDRVCACLITIDIAETHVSRQPIPCLHYHQFTLQEMGLSRHSSHVSLAPRYDVFLFLAFRFSFICLAGIMGTRSVKVVGCTTISQAQNIFEIARTLMNDIELKLFEHPVLE